MKHVVQITTVPQTLGFVSGLVDTLTERGWRVSVVTSPGRLLDDFARTHDVGAHAIEMARAITPGRDLDALARLTDLLLDLAPDIVHTHTPKAGLLGIMAARATLVPVVVYHMRGLLTPTARGVRRALFTAVERTSCAAADFVACQSPSLRQLAIDQGLVAPQKSGVLAHGGNGVDARGRFNPEHVDGLDVRAQLHIERDAPVIGFVGRLVVDKGIAELIAAWKVCRDAFPAAHLLVIGPFEQRDAVPRAVREALVRDPRVHLAGWVSDTPRYYEAMDFVVLPSHREGLPNVPLEAAAMGIPTITTDAVGCVDAVVDEVTGQIVDVGNANALAAAMRRYLGDPELRRRHGAAARDRVLRDFNPADVHRAVLELYERLLFAS